MPTDFIGENTGDTLGGNSIDAYLDENDPTGNTGGSNEIGIRFTSGFSWNPLFSFPDITGISGPVTVSSSSINVYQKSSQATFTMEARKLLRDWVELETTFNKASTTPDLDWSSGGAQSDGSDRNSTVSATGSWDSTIGYKSISGSQLNTDCETDINGSTTHYGWIPQRSDAENFSNKFLVSRTSTDGQRPFLSITHEAVTGNTMSMSDVVEFSDSAALTAAGQMSMNDTMVFSETFSNTAAALMSLSDTVEFSDTAQNTAALIMSLSDSVIFSDSVSLQSGNFMNLSDGFEFADSFSADSGVITLTMNDGFTLSDAVSQIAAAVMGMDDGFVLTDTASLNTGILVEGPIKISVRVKQSKFDIVIKQPKFDIEVN